MTIEEIYQNLAEEFRARTGLSAGGCSELAVRFYAVAAQLHGLYRQIEWAQHQCFPQTAEGERLDLHAALRSISRKQPAKAAGTVRFFAGEERSEPSVIPCGTVCMTADGIRYLTTGAGVIPVEESSVDLPVEAAEAGGSSNAGPQQIIYLSAPPSGITACTNPQAVSGGRDAEDDEALRQRVLDSYRRLSNGANTAFYEQTAMSFENVAAVTVLPRRRGTGTVDVVVAARDGIPGEAMLQEIQAHFDQVREIAVDVLVTPPAEAEVNVSVALTPQDGYAFGDVAQAVRDTVEGWFTGSLLGRPVLQAELTALVFHTGGVANCAVTVEGGDLPADSVTLPRPGIITVTEG